MQKFNKHFNTIVLMKCNHSYMNIHWLKSNMAAIEGEIENHLNTFWILMIKSFILKY